jgi:p-hydroxybenzoate 3-monooxygenase
VSRLYVQCDPRDQLSDWSDDRVWSELHQRMAVGDGWTLTEGPIIDKSITPMRSSVMEPMQHGRLFLAGDAAHIVPPTGAKGLNLAVADAAVLAAALTTWYQVCSSARLDAYSSTCLPRVWRVQQFTAWMTWMFHTWPQQGEFLARLQTMQLASVCASPTASRAFAENFVGLPLGTPLPETGVPLPRDLRPGRADRRGGPLRVSIESRREATNLALPGSPILEDIEDGEMTSLGKRAAAVRT